MSQTASTPPRRTQAQRRAATRAALLDAALACLVEEGYANLTTRRVAERAGVSQATQMHYFPTRQAFLAEALGHVAAQLLEEVRTQAELRARSEQRRLEALLDQVWEIHKGPVFQATVELWVAARTDPELGAAMDAVSRDVARLVAELAGTLLPATMAKPGAGQVLDLGMAAVRGLALLAFTGPAADADRRWRSARARLLELYAAL